MKSYDCPRANERAGRQICAPPDLSRRQVFKVTAGGVLLSCFRPFARLAEAGRPQYSSLFWVTDIPNLPFKKKRVPRRPNSGISLKSTSKAFFSSPLTFMPTESAWKKSVTLPFSRASTSSGVR